ncbi:hypothetical protein THOM_2781 [Trachipleistophora hominis]|uniref:Uncharacterized protein n=1 Tax=Trachipleistophora hominis TaxID=72359 RepID=L7JSM9_TRAHO|nr:hypothetical protein THOM_2781 [Trachipleistophora hominis]
MNLEISKPQSLEENNENLGKNSLIYTISRLSLQNLFTMQAVGIWSIEDDPH